MSGREPGGEDLVTLTLTRRAVRLLDRGFALGLLRESSLTGAPHTPEVDAISHTLRTAAQTRPGFAPETPTARPATVDPGFASRVLGMTEVAAELGCSVQFARRLAQSGRLRADRVGRTGPWLTTPADLDAYRYGRQEDTHGEPGPAPRAGAADGP